MNRSTCTICSDYLTVTNCTACPCGHTFHYVCIMTWKEHSATCPQCRIRFKEPIKLYFESSTAEDTEVDSADLKNQLTDLNLKLKEKDRSMEQFRVESTVAVNQLAFKQQEVVQIKQQLETYQGTNDSLKRQLAYMEKFKTEAKRARAEAAGLERSVASLKTIQECVQGERHNVEEFMKKIGYSNESMNTIVTSHIIFKKEFEVLKDAKKKLEVEKKNLRRKAELASREAFECKEQLDVVSRDMTHLSEINKSLEQKLRKLEQSFASPSPRSSAIKRLLMESPAPLDLKRARVAEEQEANGSLILFDGPTVDDDDDDYTVQDEESKELANEFGLSYVGTTSITSSRAPLKDMNRSNATKLNIGNKKCTETNNKQTSKDSSSSSSLPYLRKGFNGMGGQSKVLVIPKKTTGVFVKPLPKTNSKKLKIPSRNNTKISKFLSSGAPRLPNVSLSP